MSDTTKYIIELKNGCEYALQVWNKIYYINNPNQNLEFVRIFSKLVKQCDDYLVQNKGRINE